MRKEVIGNATLYLGDCLEGLDKIPRDAAIIADPQYGMNWDTDSTRFTGKNLEKARGEGRADRKIIGDDKPFDPAPWLAWDKVILWGANHYAQRLPIGSTLVWIKKQPQHYGTFLSDAEVGWQKGGHGVYVFYAPDSNGRRRMELTGSPFGQETAHPSQKPIALGDWCLERIGPAPVYVDGYMGSGSFGVSCVQKGYSFMGWELDPVYFDICCHRIEDAQRQGSMFA